MYLNNWITYAKQPPIRIWETYSSSPIFLYPPRGISFSPPPYDTISPHIWKPHIFEKDTLTERKTSLESKPQYQDLKKAFPLEWLSRKYGNAKTREMDEAKGNASIKLVIVESITAKSTTLRWTKEYSCTANACQSIPKFRCTRKSIFMHIYTSKGEGNGTPLQYSCLENPMDGGAW